MPRQETEHSRFDDFFIRRYTAPLKNYGDEGASLGIRLNRFHEKKIVGWNRLMKPNTEDDIFIIWSMLCPFGISGTKYNQFERRIIVTSSKKLTILALLVLHLYIRFRIVRRRKEKRTVFVYLALIYDTIQFVSIFRNVPPVEYFYTRKDQNFSFSNFNFFCTSYRRKIIPRLRMLRSSMQS